MPSSRTNIRWLTSRKLTYTQKVYHHSVTADKCIAEAVNRIISIPLLSEVCLNRLLAANGTSRLKSIASIELCSHHITCHRSCDVCSYGIYTLSCIKSLLEHSSEKEHLDMKNFFDRSVKIRSAFNPSFVFYLKQLFHILTVKIPDVYCHGNSWHMGLQMLRKIHNATPNIKGVQVICCWDRCLFIYITLVSSMLGLCVCSLQCSISHRTESSNAT